MNKEKYTTIRKSVEREIEKIKGSRFIGRIVNVSSKEEAEEELEKIRKRYYNATHNCFAYTVGRGDNATCRSSDDGEPSGTAGRPIMNILESCGMTDLLLVVTRYYGGTNLGTGGLVKAYSEAAKAVIEAAEKVEIEIMEELTFSYDYDMTSLVMNIIYKYGCSIKEENYDNNPLIRISINKGYVSDFKKEIYERSRGVIKAG